jgi:serine/threonine-protein phosphatase CPPED1
MKTSYFKRLVIGAALVLLLCNPAYCAAKERASQKWNPPALAAIDKNANDFSFIYFGDNQDSQMVFQRLIDRVNGEEALFSIDGGDLVAIGNKKNYAFFLKQASRFKRPCLMVVGNHDAYYGGREYYEKFIGPLDYSFAVGKSYFIILDDNRIKGLENAQWLWLEAELKKSQGYQYRFVFMHIPLYDPRLGDYAQGHSIRSLEMAKRLNSLFDTYAVTMLFDSHIHGYFKGAWGKTPYIISGGAGASLVGFSPEHFFYHYIRVTVSPSGVQYEVVKY